MSALTLSKVSAVQTRGAYGLAQRRWLHGSLKRQAILMPAMSPLMTEGTITRWKKKEGEAFVAGDVLLQIESDIYMIDVEAQCPGILGKILMPDGTSNVPVEQVIALVARDTNELALLQNQHINTGGNTSGPASPRSPRLVSQFTFNKPLSPPRTPIMTPRTLSLFEMHTMGYGHRSAHVGGPRGGPALPRLDSSTAASVARELEVPPCPSPQVPQQQEWEASTPMTPSTARWPMSAVGNGDQEKAQMDGAAIRRMILSNLSSKQSSKAAELDEFF